METERAGTSVDTGRYWVREYRPYDGGGEGEGTDPMMEVERERGQTL